MSEHLTHLKELEAESIYILREVAAQFERPCILFSGGKDSSVVAGLCVKALGKERVIGVLMPNGKQADIDCAYALVSHLDIPYYVCNIEKSYKGALYALKKAGVDLTTKAPFETATKEFEETLAEFEKLC